MKWNCKVAIWTGLLCLATMPNVSQAQVGVGTGGFGYNYYGAGGPRYGLNYGRYGFGYGLNAGYDNTRLPSEYNYNYSGAYRRGFNTDINPYAGYGYNPYGYGRYNDLDRNDDWYYDFYDRDYGVSYGEDLLGNYPYDYSSPYDYSNYFDVDADDLLD